MAQLCLSLADCESLINRFKRLNQAKRIFYKTPKNDDEEQPLTCAAYAIANAITEAYQLRVVWTSTSFSSQKQVNNFINVLNELIS